MSASISMRPWHSSIHILYEKKVLTLLLNTTVMDIKAPKITKRTLPCILNLSLLVLCAGILKKGMHCLLSTGMQNRTRPEHKVSIFFKCSGFVLSILCTPVGASNGLFLYIEEFCLRSNTLSILKSKRKVINTCNKLHV